MKAWRSCKNLMLILGAYKVGEIGYRIGNTLYTYKSFDLNSLEFTVGNKRACVTGAGQEFGKAFARELASRNFNLLLIDNETLEFKVTVKELREEFPKLQIESRVFPFKTSEIKEYEQVVEAIGNYKTSLLVNCFQPENVSRRFGDSSFQEFQEQFAESTYPIPLISSGFLYKEAGAKDTEMKKGLINVTSVNGEAAIPFLATTSSGFSLSNYFSKSLQIDKPKNSSVLLVTPESINMCASCNLFPYIYSSREEYTKEAVKNSLSALGNTNWISGTLYDELHTWYYKPFECRIGKKRFMDGLVEMYHNK